MFTSKDTQHNNINVFIVEDNDLYMKSLKRTFSNAFESRGNQLFHYFEDAESCLKYIKETGELPNLLITDYFLEDYYNPFIQSKNGFELALDIAQYKPTFSVIMLTNETLNINYKNKQFNQVFHDQIFKKDKNHQQQLVRSIKNYFVLEGNSHLLEGPETEKNAIIIDDDKLYRLGLKSFIESKYKIKTTTFESIEQCLKTVKSPPQIILLDFFLTDTQQWKQGICNIDLLRELFPNSNIIVISGDQRIEVFNESIKNGANSFIPKGQGIYKKLEATLNE